MLIKIKDPESASVDRINSAFGYVEGNVQLVCQFANFAKMSHPNEKIKDLFKRAAKALSEVSTDCTSGNID